MFRGLKIMFAAVVATMTFAGGLAADIPQGWTDDPGKAQEQARRRNLPILVLFSGTTWCPPCIQLRKNLLDTQPFQEYIKDNVIALYVDIPSRSTPEERKARQERYPFLPERFGVPAIFITDSKLELIDPSLRPASRTVEGFRGAIEKARELLNNPESGKARPAAPAAPDSTPPPVRASMNWLLNYDSALAEARQRQKPVLALFTGSRSCCNARRNQVNFFSTSEFQDLAPEFVLLRVDLASSAPKVRSMFKDYRKLQKRFKLDCFPSVVLLSSDGEEMGRIAECGVSNQDYQQILQSFSGNANPPLIRAILSGKKAEIAKLGSSPAEVNKANPFGYTALMAAAAIPDAALVSALVKAGAELNATDLTGNTALFLAAGNENASPAERRAAIMVLLKANAEVNAPSGFNRKSPFLAAAAREDSQVLGMMLQAGADRSALSNGQNALQIAVAENSLEVVKFLLEQSFSSGVVDSRGRTLLHIAASANPDPEKIRFLLRQKIDPMKKDRQGRTALETAEHLEWHWRTTGASGDKLQALGKVISLLEEAP